MDADVIPVHAYDPAVHQDKRIQSLVKGFKSKFSRPADVIVRVPGRVNIIGEHVDYCGYPVLPMAIDQSILIAAGRSGEEDGGLIALHNADDTFPSFSSSLTTFSISRPPKWHDYFLCGLEGVLESAAFAGDTIDLAKGLQVMVDGTIPPAAGLSSSSALVCGSAVVSRILFLNEKTIPKKEMASSCAKYEHLIGTQGGGMDQAIQMLAEAGSAKFVDFVPELAATSVPLPSTAVFFVSHCGLDCNKAASHQFNTRVLETKVAALIIYKKMGMAANVGTGRTLSDVQRSLGAQVTDMLAIVDKCLKKEPYSLSDVLQELELASVGELMSELGFKDTSRFDESIKSDLKLHQRSSHVYREAARVYEFRKVCEDESLDEESKIHRLGSLMNDSHESLRVKYECSCSELDSMVQACRSEGAIGSRLTGAGWGGCCLSLLPKSRAKDFKSRMLLRFPNDNFTFQTAPGDGTAVFLI